MNKSESKYFNTAAKMDEAFFELLEKKDFDYITVKEICEKAGVNRSTFYLHYETIDDLLLECADYISGKCFDRYGEKYKDIKEKITSADHKDLLFITPEYLKPYLQFVKENKRLLRVVLAHHSLMRSEVTFEKLFRSIFSPVMDRFNYAEEEKKYVISFYLSGLTAIISEWLKDDCAEPIDKITNICIKCILPNYTPEKGAQNYEM